MVATALSEGYLSLHVIRECLGFLIGPSDLVVVTKRRDFSVPISLVQLPQTKLWNFRLQSDYNSARCMFGRSFSRKVAMFQVQGWEPMDFQWKQLFETEKPPLFHWKFCPTVAGCFFIQKPLGFHNGVATKCLKTAHQTYLPKVSKGCPFRFCPLSLLAGSLF